jgi:hypothetical protein
MVLKRGGNGGAGTRLDRFGSDSEHYEPRLPQQPHCGSASGDYQETYASVAPKESSSSSEITTTRFCWLLLFAGIDSCCGLDSISAVTEEVPMPTAIPDDLGFERIGKR